MPGVPGARPPQPKPNTARIKLWNSIRILRRFTVPDLLRTIPSGTRGASYNNAGKFVASLATHGIITRVGTFSGGRPGTFQQYQLLVDSGPNYPVTCGHCGQFITAKTCQKTDKETEKQTEIKEQPDDDIRPPAAAAR